MEMKAIEMPTFSPRVSRAGRTEKMIGIIPRDFISSTIQAPCQVMLNYSHKSGTHFEPLSVIPAPCISENGTAE